MANRRMFSMKIVDTDAFLDMPSSSQLLYFHLAMRADDDGFVSNPKKVMRMIGAGEDDYKVLVAKKFVLPFESGVCVIKHWLIHNLVRGDRYSETQYIREKSQLLIDPKSKKYSLNKGERIVIPKDNHSSTEDRVRLGEVRKGEDSIEVDEELSPGEIAKKFFDGDKELVGSIGKQLEDAGINSEIVLRELIKFKNYWTEPTKSGKKQRWELQPTFDVKRRLGTWFRNIAERSKSNKRAGGGVTV